MLKFKCLLKKLLILISCLSLILALENCSYETRNTSDTPLLYGYTPSKNKSSNQQPVATDKEVQKSYKSKKDESSLEIDIHRRNAQDLGRKVPINPKLPEDDSTNME